MLIESLLSDCKNLLKSFTNHKIDYIIREANQCADFLAKMGARQVSTYVLYDKSLPDGNQSGPRNDGNQSGPSLKDPLQVPDGPITRSRAKKIKEAMQGLMQST